MGVVGECGGAKDELLDAMKPLRTAMHSLSLERAFTLLDPGPVCC